MTIHYHGTPLTPRSEMMKMAGKNFCVSFANPGDAEWCLLNGQSIAWDNGEYVFYKRRLARIANGLKAEAQTNWSKFYAWVEPKLGHPHWAVVPDVIGGGVEDNLALIKQWPFRKEVAAVVWHLDEPIEHLIALVELGFGKICFGSAGAYWQVGSEKWARRVDEAFNALIRHFGHLPWIHMLRGLAVCGDVWPFASADSTNVARNFKNKGSEVCPERMARRIDAIQCPPRWVMKPANDNIGDLFHDIAC
jgi:hypothetical protein